MIGLISPDKKKSVASVVLAKLGGHTPAPESAEYDGSPGLEAAMDKFINCVHSKDTKGAVSALCDFIEMHDMPASAPETAEAEAKP